MLAVVAAFRDSGTGYRPCTTGDRVRVSMVKGSKCKVKVTRNMVNLRGNGPEHTAHGRWSKAQCAGHMAQGTRPRATLMISHRGKKWQGWEAGQGQGTGQGGKYRIGYTTHSFIFIGFIH